MSKQPVQLDPRAARLLRLRRLKRTAFGAALALMFLCVVASHSLLQSGLATDKARFQQRECRVVEVVQGDTLRVTTEDGAAATVRLVGVDANGSDDARAFAEAACGGGVRLYLQDVPTRDHAGDLLAYVFLPDGSLLNQELIARGLAYADRRWEYAYRSPFMQLEAAASKRRVGLWADDAHEGTMPEWRKRWLTEVRKKPWKRQEWVRPDEP